MHVRIIIQSNRVQSNTGIVFKLLFAVLFLFLFCFVFRCRVRYFLSFYSSINKETDFQNYLGQIYLIQFEIKDTTENDRNHLTYIYLCQL